MAMSDFRQQASAPSVTLDTVDDDGHLYRAVQSRDQRTVERVHPATGKRRRIVIGGTPYDVAFYDGSLWATSASAGAVVRVDPRTNRVVARIVTGGTPANLTAAFGSLWAGSATGTAVFRIDTETNTATRVETGGEGPGSVEPVRDALWVSQQGSNTVAKLDPETGEVIATVPVGTAPSWPADAGDGTLLVPNARADTVSRIDTGTNRVVQTIRVGGGPAVFRRAFGDLWLTHLRGSVWRLRVG